MRNSEPQISSVTIFFLSVAGLRSKFLTMLKKEGTKKYSLKGERKINELFKKKKKKFKAAASVYL